MNYICHAAKARILIFFVLCSVVLYSQPEKYVIGVRRGPGFFACLFDTLSHLVIAEQQRKIPVVYWGKNSLYFEPGGYNGVLNAWEYYFEPVSPARYARSDVIHDEHVDSIKSIGGVFAYYCNNKTGKTIARYQVNKIMQKYIRVKSHITQQVITFYKKYLMGRKTVGIHLRGTDKHIECINTPPAEILAFANKMYKNHQFFIATDEEALLELAKKTLNGPVIYFDSFRSRDGRPVHFYSDNKAKVGEEVLIEALLLARCNIFLHTCSSVSTAVLCINPALDNISFPSKFIKSLSKLPKI